MCLVLTPEHMSSLSEQEIEETLEDVRLECARFGMVKSVQIVKQANNHVVTVGVCEAVKDVESGGQGQILCYEEIEAKSNTLDKHIDKDAEITSEVKLTGEPKEDESPDNKPADDLVEDKSCQMSQPDNDTEIQGSTEISNEDSEEHAKKHQDRTSEVTVKQSSILEGGVDVKQETFSGTVDNVEAETDSIQDTETKEQYDRKENCLDLGSIFDTGSVFVEFGRIEASWMAAHCLHGRVFEERIVTVEYVVPDHYAAYFSN